MPKTGTLPKVRTARVAVAGRGNAVSISANPNSPVLTMVGEFDNTVAVMSDKAIAK